MSMFKDVYCMKCGVKTNVLTRFKLADKNYICGQCANKIPSYMKDSVKQNYTFYDYNDLLKYINYSKSDLRPQFFETDNFYTVHLDREHGLFYLGYDINEKTVFFKLSEVSDFYLTFSPDEFKEGMFKDYVKGKVLMELEVDSPYFHREEVLDYSAKAKARQSLFGSRVSYESPKGMDLFLQIFIDACIAFREAEAYSNASDEQTVTDSELTELQRAMALFMIDRIEDITPERIKRQRNRLIKIFHPDLNNEEENTAYSQKINAAFEILSKYIA